MRPLQAAILARGDQVAWFLEGNEVNASFLHTDESQLMSVEEIKSYNPRSRILSFKYSAHFFYLELMLLSFMVLMRVNWIKEVKTIISKLEIVLIFIVLKGLVLLCLLLI